MAASFPSDGLFRTTILVWAVSLLAFMAYSSTAVLEREGSIRSLLTRASDPATTGTVLVRPCDQEACPSKRRPDTLLDLSDDEIGLRSLLPAGDGDVDP
ncbi:hypothetical protein M446_4295 [Methylobacterium sp. 4-46]|nr:hypothetical protein M446_4295 [Methylobacterium sp. 4-46]